MHPNSPIKRLEWQRECDRKRKKAYRDAQKKKASATEKWDTPTKPSATEKRDTPSKSSATEKRDAPFCEDPVWRADKNRYLSSPELSEGPALTSD